MRLLQRLLFLAFVSSTTFHVAHAGRPLNITFPSQPPGSSQNVVDDKFIAISWASYYAYHNSDYSIGGKTTATIPHTMQNYLYDIAIRMQNPLQIRFGGNGMGTYNTLSTGIQSHPT